MMPLYRVLVPTLAAVLLGLAGPGDASAPKGLEPSAPSRVASPPSRPPDTVRAATDAGVPLTLTLPETVKGRPVARYSLLRGPALSGVAGRSFVWIPEGAAPGSHHVLLRADAADAPPDTLVVQIDVRS
jgi:hypothetical protein